MQKLIASWEPEARSILRIILGFVITLHGFHKLFGVFALGGRRNNPIMALETLPQALGVLETVGGILLFVGLFAKPIATLLCLETLWAYFSGGLPNGILPMRNGSQESTLLGFLLLYIAFAGAGAWSLDQWLEMRKQREGRAASSAASSSWLPEILSIVRIAVALLFLQHGLEKFFGIPNGRVGPPMPLWSQRWWSAVLEFYGGLILAAGLFPRMMAFILCGEMAVAYFSSWVPQGKWIPITGSEEAVVFCFAFLWLVAAGPGRWSLDGLLFKRRKAEKITAETAPAAR
jgi:putative oxidoreductase